VGLSFLKEYKLISRCSVIGIILEYGKQDQLEKLALKGCSMSMSRFFGVKTIKYIVIKLRVIVYLSNF
jgi:hypothetical protein